MSEMTVSSSPPPHANGLLTSGALTDTSARSNVPALLNFIAAAARDPSVDVTKFESLLRMQREILADEARQTFGRAMAAVQAEMRPIVRDAENKQTNSRYAKLESIDAIIRPIYAGNGFSLSFDSPPATPPNIKITCEVSHIGGHSKTYTLESGLDIVGAKGVVNKTALHGLGSTISYMQRYLTRMIFNVVLTDEDDDGNGGGSPFVPHPTQQTGSEWIRAFAQRLDNEQNAWTALRIILAGLGEVSTQADLDAITAMVRFKQVRDTAPPEAREAINAAIAAAVLRINPKPEKPTVQRAQPKKPADQPKTKAAQALGGASAEPTPVETGSFSAGLTDQYGEAVTEDPITDPVEFASMYLDYWQDTDESGQVALSQHNADALDDAMRISAEAFDILKTTIPPIQAGDPFYQPEDPTLFEPVMPPQDRGKPSWATWIKLIRSALAEIDADQYAAWSDAQRPVIAQAPATQRTLAVRAIAARATALHVEPAAWLGEMLGSKPESEDDSDERWVANSIAQIQGLDRTAFDALVASTAVQTIMARLRKDKPALFTRAKQAFDARHQQLPPARATAGGR